MGLNGSRRLFFRLLKLLTRETDESAFPNTSSVRSSASQFIARSRAGPGRAGPGQPSPAVAAVRSLLIGGSYEKFHQARRK